MSCDFARDTGLVAAGLGCVNSALVYWQRTGKTHEPLVGWHPLTGLPPLAQHEVSGL